jgi:hypothetical protein
VRFSEFWIFLALVYAQARYRTWARPTGDLPADEIRW